MDLSLTRSKLDGQALRCLCHRTRFDLCSRENLGWAESFAGVPTRWSDGRLAVGRKPRALQPPTIEDDGRVWVELQDAGARRVA